MISLEEKHVFRLMLLKTSIDVADEDATCVVLNAFSMVYEATGSGYDDYTHFSGWEETLGLIQDLVDLDGKSGFDGAALINPS